MTAPPSSPLLIDHPMVLKAYHFYDDWGQNPFWRYVGMHQFNGGHIFYDDTYFIMGRPIKAYPEEPKRNRAQVTNPEYRFPEESWNCWFIWLYAGNVQKAFTNFPFWLPYFAYERRDNLHITNINKTMLKLTGKDTRHGLRINTQTTRSTSAPS